MNPNNSESDKLVRREFLTRVALASVLAATAGVGSLATYTSQPYQPMPKTNERNKFTDYAIADMHGKMSIATNSENRGALLRQAFLGLGGIERFVKRGDVVMLKPNMAFASPARFSATSHPDTLEAMIQLCRDAGASEIRLTDNPINDPENCFRLSGIEEIAKKYGVKLILPKSNLFRSYTLPNGRLIKDWPVLLKPFEDVTRVFGISPVKDHTRSGASLTMKNWYGLLGGRRNIFHQDIAGIIVELAQMIHPTAVILDGTTTMMTNGPTGGSSADLKQTNTMIVSTDMVAADAYAATVLLERDLGTLPWIERASELRVGVCDWKSLHPVIMDLSQVSQNSEVKS